MVLIDAAHHNFHTAEARFKPFADLLRNDGFKVAGSQEPFTSAVLARAKMMVIANALNQVNVDHGELPTPIGFHAGGDRGGERPGSRAAGRCC